MVHIPLGFLRPDGVHLLGRAQHVQGADGQHLGLSAGEQAGAVDPGQDPHLGGQGANLVLGAAVHPVALQQPGLDNLLLELVGDFLQIFVHLGELLQEKLVPAVDEGVPALLPDVLVVGVHGGAGLVHGLLHNLVKERLVEIGVLVGHFFLANLRHDGTDKLHLLLNFRMGLENGVVHDVVGELLGPGLNHNHLSGGGGNGQVQLGLLLLGLGGVHDDLPVHIAHLQTADGARPGDVGVGQTGGHANHGGDLGGARRVQAHDGGGHHHVVAEVGGKQGPDGPVDDPAGQHGGQGGLTLPAEEGAGDAAHGIELFLKVHAQGEEVDAVPGPGGAGDGHHDGGLPVGDHGGSGGQLGHLAHLNLEGTARHLGFIQAAGGKFLVLDNG